MPTPSLRRGPIRVSRRPRRATRRGTDSAGGGGPCARRWPGPRTGTADGRSAPASLFRGLVRGAARRATRSLVRTRQGQARHRLGGRQPYQFAVDVHPESSRTKSPGCLADQAPVAGAEVINHVAGLDVRHVEHLVDDALRGRHVGTGVERLRVCARQEELGCDQRGGGKAKQCGHAMTLVGRKAVIIVSHYVAQAHASGPGPAALVSSPAPAEACTRPPELRQGGVATNAGCGAMRHLPAAKSITPKIGRAHV